MAVSGRFVALLSLGVVPVLALGPIVGSAATMVAWVGIAVVLGVVDLCAAASPRRVALARDLPDRVRLDASVDAVLLVTNHGRRTLRADVRDAWQPTAGAAPTRFALRIGPGQRRRATSTLTPTRRGERRTVHVTIRSWGPLRLWGRQATVASPGAVRVLPAFRSRRLLPSKLARLRELDGSTTVLVRGQGSEFDSLREYVRGDDVRSIDWRASARRADAATGGQQLVVRTWRPERDRRVVIVVDTGRLSAARVADETRLDTAFEASLLLTALASRAGDRVDVLAYDRRVRAQVHGAHAADVVSRTVDALATVEPELIETDWAAVPARVRELTAGRALVVLLTALDSAGSTTELLTMLPELTRRHTVVVASVLDPEVRAATTRRGDREAVYLAAAAERSLLDSARVAAAVRRTGGEVVSAPPADLPGALTDTYLTLKAAGRL